MNFNKTYYACIITVLLGYILLVYSCQKEEKRVIDNLNNGKITIIGHAGAGFSSLNNPIPENSMTSIKKAIELYGAEGVEIDVQLSADNNLFLYHDEYLNSSTNFQGCIHSHSTAELKNCLYNNSNEKIATLEECLQYCSSRKYFPRIFIDTRLKVDCESNLDHDKFTKEYADQLYALICKYNAESWVCVESDDSNFLNLIKAKNKKIALFLDGTIAVNLISALENNFTGIVVSNRSCTKEQVKQAHMKGIYVCIFEAYNRQEIKQAIEKSPDIIQTDNIQLLKLLLE
jgi:glycerophosphoryl diester phosphodiesterase